jgi:hypothetical protein
MNSTSPGWFGYTGFWQNGRHLEAIRLLGWLSLSYLAVTSIQVFRKPCPNKFCKLLIRRSNAESFFAFRKGTDFGTFFDLSELVSFNRRAWSYVSVISALASNGSRLDTRSTFVDQDGHIRRLVGNSSSRVERLSLKPALLFHFLQP